MSTEDRDVSHAEDTHTAMALDAHGDHPPAGASHHGHPVHDDGAHAGHQHHTAPTDHSAHTARGHGHGHGGHGHDHGDHADQFRRLWVMLALAIPTTLLSGSFAMILGYELPDVPGIGAVAPVLGSVIYLWGGRPFLTGAVDDVRRRQPGMMLLVGLAITVAFLSSWGATLGVIDHMLEFWWELALLVVIMLLGHWIEMRSLAQSASALDSLAALIPDGAERVEGSGVVVVEPAELAVGDVVLVRPGGRVPADGKIVAGGAAVDESMITGESVPVQRGEGDAVVAGTVATDSGLRVRVTAVGESTALAGIQRLVSEAQSSTSRAQRLADRAAGWLFWYAAGAAAVTAVAWLVWGTPEMAVMRVITVLVIACPHALGLAIPLVVSIATERSARGGVLVKDRLALERMRTVDTVLFDKTGTLTRGEPTVVAVDAVAGTAQEELLALAAAVEAPSEHPLARAVVRAAETRGLTVPRVADFRATTGVGVRGVVDGATVAVGGPALLAELGAPALENDWYARGRTVLHVLRDGQVLGALGLADEVRPESRQAVAALHELGVEVVMITGDAEPVARSVAAELGIDRVLAGVRPEHKNHEVAELQRQGRTVAMVGDGVNDAPALAQADVGIAIGAGTDVAIGSAGVILASDDPRSVLSVIHLSRASYRKMKQNLWWAAGYNLAAVPLAAGVLAPVGFVMPMAVGAILMSLSTVVVALNAQLLRRIDLASEASMAARGAHPLTGRQAPLRPGRGPAGSLPSRPGPTR